jgi:hypothetical protein
MWDGFISFPVQLKRLEAWAGMLMGARSSVRQSVWLLNFYVEIPGGRGFKSPRARLLLP